MKGNVKEMGGEEEGQRKNRLRRVRKEKDLVSYRRRLRGISMICIVKVKTVKMMYSRTRNELNIT